MIDQTLLEPETREEIDLKPLFAGWIIQNKFHFNLWESLGVVVRETYTGSSKTYTEVSQGWLPR